MAAVTPLEDLLRAVSLQRGRIALDRLPDGEWGAGIYPFDNSHPSFHHLGNTHGDPVDALRAALIGFEREERDLERRYQAALRETGEHNARRRAAMAAVFTEPDADDSDSFEDAVAPGADDDFGDLLG
ncbi:hypothetical protein [Novosphingobium resinovorum]|uniref:Uncharacterized protein n=1 Tax=Novosphingobium resinovorum TaxID=158500 RepID=A0A1D8A372_9SPHN|nr:hypothetical protein [Novosphingobium resinovorum]AOR76544.1 hypothetical protein BES08_07140 [Novosphingobium resinovorum]